MMEIEILNDAAEVSQEHDTFPVSSAWFGEVYLQDLRSYSRTLLYDIVFGNNNANENRFLREIYWRTVEALANLED